MNIRHLVVGVDGSEPAWAAIRWAGRLALRADTTLTLVHVADDHPGSIGSATAAGAQAAARGHLDSALAYVRSFVPDVQARAVWRVGSPMSELSAFADAETMLVVGTHKTGFQHGRVSGSRSLQLANLALGPVAVIPDDAFTTRREVVVGVDDTPAGFAAIVTGAELASQAGRELLLVRAVDAAESPVGTGVDASLPAAERDEHARGLLERAVAYARCEHPDVTVRPRLVTAPAAAALNDLSRGAGMLVIGDSRRHPARPGTLGTVAYDVLFNVTAPTVVVHSPAASATPERPTPGTSARESTPAPSYDDATRREPAHV